MTGHEWKGEDNCRYLQTLEPVGVWWEGIVIGFCYTGVVFSCPVVAFRHVDNPYAQDSMGENRNKNFPSDVGFRRHLFAF